MADPWSRSCPRCRRPSVIRYEPGEHADFALEDGAIHACFSHLEPFYFRERDLAEQLQLELA